MQPRKLISVWNPPRRRTISRRSLPKGSDIMIFKAFHHSGWSKVIIGVTLCLRACSVTNFNVEKMQVGSLELMSIIGRNVTEDWPGWLPRWTYCIIPDQAGREKPNKSDVFHRISRLAVGSRAFWITMSLYFISISWFAKPWCCIWMHPAVEISSALTCLLGTSWLCVVPGVTAAMIPMPWNVSLPSKVLMLWSTLSATYWTNSEVWLGISVPWFTAGFCPNVGQLFSSCA